MDWLHRLLQVCNRYFPKTNHWLVLSLSIPVALATGTIFVYSVYATQLAERCKLDASQTANLNISATIGSAVGGLASGLVTDAYGTQLPILFSCVAISLGYRWLYGLYLRGPESTELELLLAMFLIGNGSVAGYFSSMKAVVLHFPKYKSTAQSLTIASFAISSLLFLFISSRVLHGDTAKFLYMLHVVCGVLIFIGFVFIRIEDQHDQERPGQAEEVVSLIPEQISFAGVGTLHEDSETIKARPLKSSVIHPVFWYHYLIAAVSQGLGQMYIYSVGFILKAIHYYYSKSVDSDESFPSLQQLQALHVSIIAISSFAGRVSSGPLSDFVVRELKAQRHWILVLGLSLMLVGHLLNIVDVGQYFYNIRSANFFLLFVSFLIGYSYGFCFTCFPVLISDIFNMKNYSFLWGVMYSSTTFGLIVMTKIFGYFYDKNSLKWSKKNHEYICESGVLCYNSTFKITSIMCIFTLILLLFYIKIRVSR